MNESKKRISIITVLLIFILIVSFRVLISEEKDDPVSNPVSGKVTCEKGAASCIVVFLSSYPYTAEVTDLDGEFTMKLPQFKLHVGSSGVFVAVGKSRVPEPCYENVSINNTLILNSGIECDKFCWNCDIAYNLKDLIRNDYSDGKKIKNETTLGGIIAMLVDLLNKKLSSPGDQNGGISTSRVAGGMKMTSSRAANFLPIEGEGEVIDISAFEISPRQTEGGIFLDRAYSEFSQNTGFHFAPAIDLNEAVFWNSSAIMLAVDSQVSFHTDWRRYVRFSTLFKPKRRFTWGVGFYFLHQEENRTAQISSGSTSITDSFRCDEWVANISLAGKLFKNFYVGLSPKLIHQEIEDPTHIEIAPDGTPISFIKDDPKKLKCNLDISSTFRPASFLRIGISFMNIFGKGLRTNDNELKKIRSLGLGVSLQGYSFILGGEIRIREGKDNISFGLRFVPFKYALIRFGWSPTDNLYSVGLSYKNIFLSFNHNAQRGGYFLLGTRFIF